MADTGQDTRLDLDVTQHHVAVLKPDKVTIIVPVFNAYDTLKECLERVAANTDVQWRMILVEDCSTDSEVRPWLSRWADRQCAIGHDVQLILNETNLGFIGSVNRAFVTARRYADHVILLNSDALVPPNWAGRLLHPICSNTKVASVTPMSNDAEIMNAPVACRPHALPEASVDAIDAGIVARIGVQAWISVPTGVGFCMAINAGFLRKLDQFDPIFGKGYGEEVDWCQKVRGLGGVHAAQPALFVEHKGGASFGSSAKLQAIKKNNALVSTRHPGFDRDVQQFLVDDPLKTPRMIHAMSMTCATQARVPVFIAHSMGGGAELYLKEQIDDLVAQGNAALILRVGGTELWGIEHHSPMGCLRGSVSTNADVMRLLEGWQNLDIVYSCGVGHSEPKSIPALLANLSRLPSRKLILLIHDYFCLSEAYTLLDDEGRFSGINPLGARDHIWRRIWREALTASDDIRCFSRSSRNLVAEAYPDCGAKIHVAPHQIPTYSKVSKSGQFGPIGVLGDIGAQKGAAIVSRLTRTANGETDRRIVIVGRLDPAFACGALGDQTGPYTRDQISEIAQRLGLSCWLIPSIWPETFSYTTHEALATGLPVFVFDIGGQAEAARAASNGYVMPMSWAFDPPQVTQFINGVLKDVADGGSFNQGLERRRRRGFAA